MKKIVLFLVMFLSGVAVMAFNNSFEYESLDGAQIIDISYMEYGDGDNGSGEVSHTWQSSSTNIITEAIYVYSGSYDMSLFQKGSQFALEIEGVANATGTLQTGIVDEQAEAGYWCSNSDYASPEIMITAGEQFTAKFVYTIKQLASEGFVSNDGQFYQTASDIPGLMFRFLMADYDAATEFNNGIAPSEDITNVKKVEFNFTKFTFSYLGDLNQYTKPYVLLNNEVVFDEAVYAYQTTFSLAYDNAVTTSDFFNYNISGYSSQDIDSLYIALWDASYMATQPYATSLCTDDISGMTMIAAEIKSNEPFQLQGSLPIVRNSNGTENNYNVLLYALSSNNELQIILDLEGADEFSIGAELYGETSDEVQYAVVDGIRYGYAADTAFVANGMGEVTYEGDIVIPSIVTIAGRNYSVTKIDSVAFATTAITSVLIPESVTTIGDSAFVYLLCDNLSQVACSSIIPPKVSNAFEKYTATLIIPCDAYDAYKNDEIWGKFENIECRSLHASDISNIEITDGDVLPTINLSEFFTKAENEEISFEVKSSDDEVVYPVLMGNKLGFVQYGTGTATITVTATVEPISMSKSFNVTINPKPDQPEIPCDLSISSEITNATCNSVANGKIELSVSGGTEPYQYKWTTGRTSSGIYNVGSGTYSVLVMDDNGCTAMETFSVSEPSALAIFETPTNPSCGESNGSIDVNVLGGTEPYSYAWKGTTQTTNVVENLSTGTYVLTVTDGNGCTSTKTISLSEQNAPTITLQSVTASKCNDATGSIEIAVANGTTPYTYEWSDSSEVANALNRPKMFAGDYTLTVIDGKNCRATLAVTVPPIPFKQPEIALVSYGKQSKHNLIVWKKEQTNEIDKYLIYRETEQNGEYEQIGSQNYNEISVFVDETTNPRTNPNPYRYRISAANKCLESPLSHESKTINLQWKRDENNAIHLWWDAYEGVEYVKFKVYRLTRGGQFMVSEVPANKFRYIAENPEPETMGYFVAVDLIEEIDVTQAMKSESGPFIIVVSNIAELENFVDAIDDIAENQAIVYANGKNIMVNSSEQANVVVFDIAGQLVAQQNAVQSTMIPVKTAGVYVVIVGDKAYKVVVQ